MLPFWTRPNFCLLVKGFEKQVVDLHEININRWDPSELLQVQNTSSSSSLTISLFIFTAQCRNSLGMQSGEIADSAITASSSFDDDSVGPKNGR